jgi:MFS family permease
MAVAAVYLVQGLCFASLLTNVPALKERFELSDGALTLVLLAVPVVAGVGSLLAGLAAARLGSAAVLRPAAVGVCVAVALVGLAARHWQLYAAVAVFGLMVGAVDAAMNMQGVAVQWWYGRSILASFHGVWSVAGIAGALATSGAAALSVPTGAALGAVGVVGAAIALAAGRLLVRPAEAPVPSTVSPAGPLAPRSGRPILLIGLGVMVMFVAESATSNWSAVYLHDRLGANRSVAALGVAAYLTSQVLGRGVADRVVQRFGPARTVAVGGLVGAVGLLLVAVAGSPLVALVGFAVVGTGLCVVVPQAFSAAGALDVDGSGAAIARVNLFNYAGFVVGAALVGVVAEAADLRFAFVVPAVLVAGIVAVAPAFAVAVRKRDG